MSKDLTQGEADNLFAMEKVKIDDQEWDLPFGGNAIKVPLESKDGKEKFLLDASTGQLNISRFKLQNRTRETIILRRLDLTSPHRNPDGQEIGVPHLHIYKEGYGDKWAYELPNGVFTNLNDRWQVLVDFMKYCNISDFPSFRKGLF